MLYRPQNRDMDDLNTHALQFVSDGDCSWSFLDMPSAGFEIMMHCMTRLQNTCRSRKVRRTEVPLGMRWVVKPQVLTDDMVLVIGKQVGGAFSKVMKLAQIDAAVTNEHLDLDLPSNLVTFDKLVKKVKDIRDVHVRHIALVSSTDSIVVYAPNAPRTTHVLSDAEEFLLKDARRAARMHQGLEFWYGETQRKQKQATRAALDSDMVEEYMKMECDLLQSRHGVGWEHVLTSVLPAGDFRKLPEGFVVEDICLLTQLANRPSLGELTESVLLLDQNASVRLAQTGFLPQDRLIASNNDDYRRTMYNQRQVPAELDDVRVGFGAAGGRLAHTLNDTLIPYEVLDHRQEKHEAWHKETCRTHCRGAAERQLLDAATCIIGAKLQDENPPTLANLVLHSRHILHGVKVDRSSPYKLSIRRNVKAGTRPTNKSAMGR